MGRKKNETFNWNARFIHLYLSFIFNSTKNKIYLERPSVEGCLNNITILYFYIWNWRWKFWNWYKT